MPCHAAQTPQQQGQVRTEDAARRVGLVDHHVPQPREEPSPPAVVRQDARIQHVRIGEDEVRVLAHPGPGLLVGVAVVGLGPDAPAGPWASTVSASSLSPSS